MTYSNSRINLTGKTIYYRRLRGNRPPTEEGTETMARVIDEVTGPRYHYLRVVTALCIYDDKWRPVPVDLRDIEILDQMYPPEHGLL